MRHFCDFSSKIKCTIRKIIKNSSEENKTSVLEIRPGDLP